MRTVSTITAAVLLSTTQLAFAAGSDSSSTPKPTETTTTCEKGFVWDKDKSECVEIKDSKLDDDAIYQNARELAYDMQYENALALLALAENPRDPGILTYKGYANRKMGKVELGMAYYKQALAKDPAFVLARSYMGQALVNSGDLAAAQQQLALIAHYKGQDNWPYQALERAINGDKTTDY